MNDDSPLSPIGTSDTDPLARVRAAQDAMAAMLAATAETQSQAVPPPAAAAPQGVATDGFDRAAQAAPGAAPTSPSRLQFARELSRLQMAGGRPLTDGVRERTDALNAARGDLDARNALMQQGLDRLGPVDSPTRQRFVEAYRADPAYLASEQRERDATRALADYTRTNLEGMNREFPVDPNPTWPDASLTDRAHGGLALRNALTSLAESSDAQSAIDLAGAAGRLGTPPLLAANRVEEIVGQAAPHAYLQAVVNGQSSEQAARTVAEGVRGAFRDGDLGRKLEKTGTTLRDLTDGARTASGALRTGLQAASALHTTVRAYENARNGQVLDSARDAFKSVPELASGLRDMVRMAGMTSTEGALRAFGESRLGRSLGAASGFTGAVSNAREYARTNDLRYGAAFVTEIGSAGLAMLRNAGPVARATSAIASLGTSLLRGSAQESALRAQVLPHLTTALGDRTAAERFLDNPRAIETMRRMGLSEAEILRRASDPNHRFMGSGSDVDHLRDLIRRETGTGLVR